MSDQQKEEPEIVTYKIPRIEVYQVTSDELDRIEEGCSRVAQDLMFAVTFLTFMVSFLIVLLTVKLPDVHNIIFTLITVICGIGFLYTGIRWWHTRKTAPNAIATIRSRKSNPQV